MRGPRRASRARLALAALALPLLGCGDASPPAAAPESRPNVIFIIADSLRADRLSLHGHTRPTSPHLETLAESGVVFERAFAQAPWTPPSMASFLTGLYQSSHGVTHSMRSEGTHSKLDARHQTLAELFRSVGYRTGAVSAQPWISDATGFAQGFDDFELVSQLKDPHGNDKVVLGGLDWIRRGESEEPFFLYLHTMDPHFPYEVPDLFRFEKTPPPPAFAGGVTLAALESLNAPAGPPSAAEREYLLELYDAEIRYVDWTLGLLDRQLQAFGLRERTLIVFTSDHGEAFYEHGVWGHITTIYNEMLHIPLVLSQPGLEARRVAEPVESVDLLPTLAALAGFEVPAGLPGRDLLREEPSGLAYSEGDGLRSFKIQSRRFSLIVDPGRRLGAFFDLAADPGESRSVARDFPQERERFWRLLREKRAAAAALALEGGESTVSLDDETREELEALGYAR